MRRQSFTPNSRALGIAKATRVRAPRCDVCVSHLLDEHVNACGVVLAQLEALNHALVSSLSAVFVEPIDKLVQSEEKVNISEAKEKLSTSRRQMDSAYRKVLEHRAEKAEADPKLQKALEDSVKSLEEVAAEGARRADLWDKAAKQEISAALSSCAPSIIDCENHAPQTLTDVSQTCARRSTHRKSRPRACVAGTRASRTTSDAAPSQCAA